MNDDNELEEPLSDKPFAVFRCDASPSLGGGHVVRSLALARALEIDGWRTAFAVSDATSATVPTLTEEAREIVKGFNHRGDEAANLHTCWPGGADLLVIDHYGWDARQSMKSKASLRRGSQLTILSIARTTPNWSSTRRSGGQRRTMVRWSRRAAASLLVPTSH